MTSLMERIQTAKTTGDQQAVAVHARSMQNLMTEHQVSPLRPMLIPLATAPIFITMFYALRRLADAPLPQLKEGGFGWVTDLTLSDPWYILPFTSMLLTNVVVRVRECSLERSH